MHWPNMTSVMFKRHLNARENQNCAYGKVFHSQTNSVENPDFVISTAFVRASEHSVWRAHCADAKRKLFFVVYFPWREWRRKCRRAGFYSLVNRYHHRVCTTTRCGKRNKRVVSSFVFAVRRGYACLFGIARYTWSNHTPLSCCGFSRRRLLCAPRKWARTRPKYAPLPYQYVSRYVWAHWHSAHSVHASIWHCFDFWIERNLAGIFQKYKLPQLATGRWSTVLYHCRTCTRFTRSLQQIETVIQLIKRSAQTLCVVRVRCGRALGYLIDESSYFLLFHDRLDFDPNSKEHRLALTCNSLFRLFTFDSAAPLIAVGRIVSMSVRSVRASRFVPSQWGMNAIIRN